MQEQVDVCHFTDYHQFVREEDEMWLEHISAKAKARAYCSIAEFRADIQQIVTNCVAYHKPCQSLFGTQGTDVARLY